MKILPDTHQKIGGVSVHRRDGREKVNGLKMSRLKIIKNSPKYITWRALCSNDVSHTNVEG